MKSFGGIESSKMGKDWGVEPFSKVLWVIDRKIRKLCKTGISVTNYTKSRLLYRLE